MSVLEDSRCNGNPNFKEDLFRLHAEEEKLKSAIIHLARKRRFVLERHTRRAKPCMGGEKQKALEIADTPAETGNRMKRLLIALAVGLLTVSAWAGNDGKRYLAVTFANGETWVYDTQTKEYVGPTDPKNPAKKVVGQTSHKKHIAKAIAAPSPTPLVAEAASAPELKEAVMETTDLSKASKEERLQAADADAAAWLKTNPHAKFDVQSWFLLFPIGKAQAQKRKIGGEGDSEVYMYAYEFYKVVDFALNPKHSDAGDVPEPSAWDGLYGSIYTIEAIKEEVNDPGSVQYQSDTNPILVEDKADGVTVWEFQVRFRMKNSYGAYVKDAAFVEWRQGKIYKVEIDDWHNWSQD